MATQCSITPEVISGLVDACFNLHKVVDKFETDVQTLVEDICKSLAPIHPASRNSWMLDHVRRPFMDKLELSGLTHSQATRKWGQILSLIQQHPGSGIQKQVRTKWAETATEAFLGVSSAQHAAVPCFRQHVTPEGTAPVGKLSCSSNMTELDSAAT